MKNLIVVDLQKGFMTKPNYIELAKKISKFLNKNQENYSKIFFTKFINDKGSLYETKLNWTELQRGETQEFAIELPQNAIILEKHGYGLDLEDLGKIKKLGVKEIDICGLQTDACVYAISFQLFDAGIFPNVLINYCSTSPERCEYSKNVLIHQFGKVDEIE